MTKDYEKGWKVCVRCGHTRPPNKLTEDDGRWTCAEVKECDKGLWGDAEHQNGVMRP